MSATFPHTQGSSSSTVSAVLFVGILLAALATLSFLVSTRQSGAQMYGSRQLAGVSLGLLVPSVAFGLALAATKQPKQLLVPAAGTILCLGAVVMFVAAYPSDWNGYGTDRTPETILLYAIGIGISIGATVRGITADDLPMRGWLQLSEHRGADQTEQVNMSNEYDTEHESNSTDEETTEEAAEELDFDVGVAEGDESDMTAAEERTGSAEPDSDVDVAEGGESDMTGAEERTVDEEPNLFVDDQTTAAEPEPAPSEGSKKGNVVQENVSSTVLLDGQVVNKQEAFKIVYDQLAASRHDVKSLGVQLHEVQLENERLRTRLDVSEEMRATPMVEWNDGKLTTLDTAVESLDERLASVEQTTLTTDDLTVSIDGVEKPLPVALETIIQLASTDTPTPATTQTSAQEKSLETRVDGLTLEVDTVKELVETLYDRLTAPNTASSRRRD